MYTKRPDGVTFIAVLYFIGGALWLIAGLLVLAVSPPSMGPLMVIVQRYMIVIGLSLIVSAGLNIFVGWGLWSLKNWARIVVIVLQAIGAVFGLVGGISMMTGITIDGVPIGPQLGGGLGALIVAVLRAAVIWYMTRPNVVESFQGYESEGILTLGTDALGPTSMAPLPTSGYAPPPPPPPTSAHETRVPEPSRAAAPPRQPTMPIGAQARVNGWLVDRQAGRQYALKSEKHIIGRNSDRADILLDHTTVSGEHAVVRQEGQQFYLYDTASTNGTYINNRQVQRQLLRDGDVVRFGQVEMVFKRV